MVKWVKDWSEVQAFRASKLDTILWAIEMPEDYPECRVTMKGIANIAITDESSVVRDLEEDGGFVKLMP